MKLKISFSPTKARNLIPDIIALKAFVYGFEKPLAELSDRIEYFVMVCVLYVVLSLLANAIANIIQVTKSECKKIVEKKKIEVKE
jgi:hypothetical protein